VAGAFTTTKNDNSIVDFKTISEVGNTLLASTEH
jgi:hypothetical protein